MRTEAEFQRVCKDRDEWRDRAEEMAEHLDERYRDGFDSGWAKAAVAAIDSMPYPLDADGEPIHVGDVMEVKFDTNRKHFTVSFIGERSVAFWVEGQPDLKSFNLDTVLLVHHHEPDVEDVLREMLDEHHRWFDGESERTIGEMVTDYAGRLRLRED